MKTVSTIVLVLVAALSLSSFVGCELKVDQDSVSGQCECNSGNATEADTCQNGEGDPVEYGDGILGDKDVGVVYGDSYHVGEDAGVEYGDSYYVGEDVGVEYGDSYYVGEDVGVEYGDSYLVGQEIGVEYGDEYGWSEEAENK